MGYFQNQVIINSIIEFIIKLNHDFNESTNFYLSLFLITQVFISYELVILGLKPFLSSNINDD